MLTFSGQFLQKLLLLGWQFFIKQYWGCEMGDHEAQRSVKTRANKNARSKGHEKDGEVKVQMVELLSRRIQFLLRHHTGSFCLKIFSITCV